MTLTEAIFHYYKIAKEKGKTNGSEAEHYYQLVSWLQDLKEIKDIIEPLVETNNNSINYNTSYYKDPEIDRSPYY